MNAVLRFRRVEALLEARAIGRAHHVQMKDVGAVWHDLGQAQA